MMCEPMDTIEELFPLNILKKIVEKVPEYNRRQLMFVSKSFYEAVCLIEEPKCVMNINNSNINGESIFDSILKSTRRIQNAFFRAHLNSFNVCLVYNILRKHGKNIKHITIGTNHTLPTRIDGMIIMELLNQVNLKSLTLDLRNVHIYWNHALRNHALWNNASLLGREGSITFKLSLTNDCDIGDDFIQLFQPHSVKEVLINGKWKQFNDFMKLQTSIQKMEISHENFLEPKFFERLNLESFGLIFEHSQLDVEHANDLLLQLVQDHPLMKRVDFYHSLGMFPYKRLCSGFEMLPFLLSVMRKMPNLEMFQLKINQRIIPHINQLYHLSKLTLLSLDVSDTNNDDLITLSNTMLPNLEKLQIIKRCRHGPNDNIQDNNAMTKMFMKNIGRSWSKIKELSFTGCLTSFNTILDNMERIEKIKISSAHSAVPFYHNSSVYSKMTTFKSLNLLNSNTSLSNILGSMPNLKELEVIMNFDVFVEYTPNLLHQLTKIKNLEVLFVSFEIMSENAVASEKEVLELKHLFSILKEGAISFWMANMQHYHYSFEQLYDELKDCSNFNVFYGYNRLVIEKNVKERDKFEDIVPY